MTKKEGLLAHRVPGGVLLGYEVGSGAPIEIPIAHMCVTGMTQQAGKTTALEGLIARSEKRAIAFITKRGERAFAGGHQLPPYFKVERFDWQYVESLIEARLGEKNRIIRSFLINVCAGAKNLADVQKNVAAARATAKGFPEGMYTQIEAYLDLVVPQLEELPAVTKLKLQHGLNVMNLEGYRPEIQALVVRSVIEHVADHEEDVITVIPEAWEFLPEGRGSPAKHAAEHLIRKGGGLRNFLWTDTQDLAGVWKLAVRASPVILIGVQREANEIKRTLANIPAGVAKPKREDLARLELGQFFACWHTHVYHVFAQPAWMEPGPAVAIAKGTLDVRDGSLVAPPPRPASSKVVIDPKRPASEFVKVGDIAVHVAGDHNLVEHVREFVARGRAATQAAAAAIAAKEELMPEKVEELMTLSRENSRNIAALTQSVNRLVAAIGSKPTPAQLAGERPPSTTPGDVSPSRTVGGLEGEEFYQWLKARLIEELPRDPRVMEIVVAQPELRLKVKRETVTVDGNSLTGRLARLILDGFFDTHTTGYKTWQELGRRGWKHDRRTTDRALGELAAKGFLRREGREGYVVVESMKRNVVEEE